jgi:hypothetical protein
LERGLFSQKAAPQVQPLSGVEFDDLLLLEELGEVFALRKGDDFALEVLNIGIEVGRDRSALEVVRSSDASTGLPVSYFDDVSNFKLETRNVHDCAVHQDVAVVHNLARLENRASIAQPPNDGGESQFKESQEVQAGVAVHTLRLLERVRELLLEHVVVAANDLLGQQLLAVLRLPAILEIRTVLAAWVLPLGGRTLRLTPNVEADSSADIAFSSSVGRHMLFRSEHVRSRTMHAT